MKRPNEGHIVQAMYLEQAQLDHVAQGCVQVEFEYLGRMETLWTIQASVPVCDSPHGEDFFPFSQKSAWNFPRCYLETLLSRGMRGLPVCKIFFGIFFSPSGNSASSSIELTEIKGNAGLGKSQRRTSEGVLKDA